jgi:hypothetical protein
MARGEKTEGGSWSDSEQDYDKKAKTAPHKKVEEFRVLSKIEFKPTAPIVDVPPLDLTGVVREVDDSEVTHSRSGD